MKSPIFNSLLMISAMAAVISQILALPDLRPAPTVTVRLQVKAVDLPVPPAPLRLAGAWQLAADDGRFGGVSALAIDRGRFLAVTDRGAVMRFDFPTGPGPKIRIADLTQGPGRFGKKRARDAEAIVPDPRGRGWWVGYEQNHSLWLYGADFRQAQASIALGHTGWSNNRGVEALLAEGDQLLAIAENGRDLLQVGSNGRRKLAFDAGADVAEAARAPDGSVWLLLRSKGLDGISQSVAPLLSTRSGYRVGKGWKIPKGAFDNFEGMAIEARPAGVWRFWLISDDGHRIMARTLLIGLDYDPAWHAKSPALGAGIISGAN